jgi:hypothetical protein
MMGWGWSGRRRSGEVYGEMYLSKVFFLRINIIYKLLLILLVLLIFATNLGCIADFGAPFLEGVRAARRDNEIERQMEIESHINYYNRTGDYRALCYAAMIGSDEAANFLYRNRVGCQIYEQNGIEYIRAVEL